MEKDIHNLLCETGYFRLRGGEVELKYINADGTVISSNKANVKNQFFDLANRDIKVKKALRIYGSRDHNWHNLYNIYEVIEEDVGGKKEIVAKGWSTNKKIANFKHTACSEKVLGDDARHGSSNNNPPQKVMLLSEAQDFILNLMKNWLQTK